MQILLKNGKIINRNVITEGDLLIRNGRIARVGGIVEVEGAVTEIDVSGKWVLPGLIDDQVHFREPGLTHKATIFTESRAAVAGGVTSFMEMPNTHPPAFTQKLLQDKYNIASQDSAANYSFYMGTSYNNLEEVLSTDPRQVCGVKIFMGSSTGNLLVDDHDTLDKLFGQVDMLIATHCEDEQTILDNLERATLKYGRAIPASAHPRIRSREACFISSGFAVELARRHGTRLHVLHITTQEELALFSDADLDGKKITAEACVHHMTFSDKDYISCGNLIKCNPAIKLEEDRAAIVNAVRDGVIDVIATDHAPHTMEEKEGDYQHAPSGLPLVQHGLAMLLQLHFAGELPIEIMVERACHAPARCFSITDRGFLDEGYHADVVVVNPNVQWTVEREDLLYKCGWSPLEGKAMRGRVEQTFVNGRKVYHDGILTIEKPGQRLSFNR